MNINRSKAPNGATHWAIDSRCYSTDGIQYYKLSHGQKYQYFNPSGEWVEVGSNKEKPVTPHYAIPEDWSGEGLPPVGVAAEAYFHKDTNPHWLPFTLKYFSEEHVVFRGPICETHMSRCEFDKYGFKFRPIRTPEQIAEEEIQTILNWMVNRDSERGLRGIAEDLHADGYRKQVNHDL